MTNPVAPVERVVLQPSGAETWEVRCPQSGSNRRQRQAAVAALDADALWVALQQLPAALDHAFAPQPRRC